MPHKKEIISFLLFENDLLTGFLLGLRADGGRSQDLP